MNPDTVLKWIKRGRLAATRTAGGHYRILRQDLAKVIPACGLDTSAVADVPESCTRPLRCWEYLSRPGAINDQCQSCLIYQVRAAWCFQTADIGCEVGQATRFGQTACLDCPYYRRAAGEPTRILVVTADARFADILRDGKKSGLELHFASDAYEASTNIGKLSPGFAVVDQDLLAGPQFDLLNCLGSDSRVPGLRIILAASGKQPSPDAAGYRKLIVAIIEKPFGVARIAEIVHRYPVERMPRPDSARSSTR